MQNIPSHEKAIRMMFKAGYTNINQEPEYDNVFSLPKNREVLTINGWKSAYDLELSDKILSNDDKPLAIESIKKDINYVLITIKDEVNNIES